jgi:shikimate kinase
LGRELAERLGRRLVVVEERVEQLAGMRVEEMRETFGVAHLKTIELQALDEILLNRGVVIRVSGDTLVSGNMLERLAETGPVFCLVAQLDAVLQSLTPSDGHALSRPCRARLRARQTQDGVVGAGQRGGH